MSTTGVAPISYLVWNERLTDHFFSPERAGQQVYLYVTEELIEELGHDVGGSLPDFVAATQVGPPWAAGKENLCQKAYCTFEDWRSRDLKRPPYIAYLALFSLAAVMEGDWVAHAYYKPLRSLLGLEVVSEPLQSFYRMYELWEDLDAWSNGDEAGQLGVFTVRFAGEWMHVGLPKAQALLTDQERHSLPEIFALSGFVAGLDPSDYELERALIHYADGRLRPRTATLLRRGSEAELLEALLDAVRDELEEWDGTSGQAEREGSTTSAALRLSLALDRVARHAKFSLRCYSTAPLPDAGLELSGDQLPGGAICEAEVPRWSTPLATAEGVVDAGALSWSSPLILRDEVSNWTTRLRLSDLHVLLPGEQQGLPGYVEASELPRNRPFMLVARDRTRSQVLEWVTSDGQDAHVLEFDGIPQGWFLLQSRGAHSDDAVRATYPALSFSSFVRIHRRGGLRSGHGASYFSFGPPQIVISGMTGSERVFAGATEITPDAQGVCRLPDRVTQESRVVIEVRRGEDVLRRLALYFGGYPDWRQTRRLLEMDEFGDYRGSEPTAEVQLQWERPQPPAQYLPLPADGRRTFLIGAGRGEIQNGVRPRPAWSPVWAVPLGRRGEAIYVGSNPESERPTAAQRAPGDTETWRDVLWVRRRQIRAPRHRMLKQLWDAYVKAARAR